MRPSTHFDDLAPASARRAHDASNRNLQSTNVTCAHVAARCARFGRAGPRRRIRRAPLASSRCLRSKVGVACRRRTVPNRRGAGSSRPNDSGAAAKRHPRHRSAYPDGDRSIRPRVDASHLSAIRDSRRERREPPFQPFLVFTDGWFRVPRRVSSPKGAGTRGHSITSVITTATRARRRRPYPRETLDVPLAWPPRIVFCCGRLRLITRKRPPVAGGAPLLCFPIPFARGCAMRDRVWISDRRRGHATPLVVAHGARRVWRHPANSIVTMLDRRTLDTNVSAKNRPHRQPEVPSIESPGVNARPTGKGPDPLARSRGRRAG